MRLFRQMTYSLFSLAAVAAVSLGAACGQLPVEGEVIQEGVKPTIVRESVGGLGGLRIRVELDSATGAWISSLCSLRLSSDECASGGTVQRGTATPAEVTRLYQSARTDEFRALKAKYPGIGQVADGMSHALTISGEGRVRKIEWEDGANLPIALSNFSEALYHATNGSLNK